MDVRRFPRRPFKYQTGCLVQGVYFTSEAIELGEGGMSIYADGKTFHQGDEFVLTFKLPQSVMIVQRARVVSVRELQGRQVYGFSFLNVSFDQKRDIRNFVSTH